MAEERDVLRAAQRDRSEIAAMQRDGGRGRQDGCREPWFPCRGAATLGGACGGGGVVIGAEDWDIVD
jgi:hypothetical protein